MAFQPGYKARVLNGDFSLSAKLSDASAALATEMLDVTVLTDAGVKRFIPGLDSSTVSLSGFTDAAVNTDTVAWTAAQPLTYGQTGLTLGSPVILANMLNSSYEVSTSLGGVASFTLSGTTDGPASPGVSLADLAAVTVDTNGTGVDLTTVSTTNGGVAHLHVTAFSGFTGAVVIVEDSANNSTWATIGTFATATTVTSERLPIAGTVRRYVRCSIDVTGSGSVTYSVAFARH